MCGAFRNGAALDSRRFAEPSSWTNPAENKPHHATRWKSVVYSWLIDLVDVFLLKPESEQGWDDDILP
jgi:hypothetical protein